MTELRKLQLTELDIVKEIIKICEKHNIKYYMLGGTLLGAVRHKGFIPWDDDIDIGMPRDDYEKFILIAKKELSSEFILNYFKDHVNEKKYLSHYITRIESEKVKLKNKTAKNIIISNAWIDVFAIDGLPNNKILSFFHKCKLLYLRMMLRYSQLSDLVSKDGKGKDIFTKFAIKVGKIINIEKHLDRHKYLDKIDKTLKKYRYNDSKYVINFSGACKNLKFIEIFPRSKYDSLIKYEFENIKLYGPKDYDYILKKQYGSYMIEPENKNKHNTETI